MGCFIVKEKQEQRPSFLRIDSTANSDQGSFIGAHLSLGQLSREITSVDEFKLNFRDFIGYKTGTIHDEYTLLDPPIGKGSFGEVRRAIHIKSNITRAVKIIRIESMTNEEQERVKNEINVLKTIDHPHIMKIIEFYQDPTYFYIVTEFFNGGELFEKIISLKHFSERKAAQTIKQILSAVNYCHRLKIVHRDLKPENILYESKKEDSLLKVIDFGTSRYFDPCQQMKQKFGTPYYIAPEVLKGNYTEKCDVWSCGVILYILLCGTPPFNGQNDKEIMDSVAQGIYDFDAPEWAEVSDSAQALIRKMLKYDPEERYSAKQVLDDPWFKLVLGEAEYDKPLMISALDLLRKFRTERKLQEAFWLFLISHTATKEERDHLLKTFQALDLNGDGKLSRDELIIGYQQILGAEHPEEEVDAIIKAVDSDRSGSIEYTEFVVATINKENLLSDERISRVFKLIDKDGDGYLNLNEVKEALNPGDQAEINDQVWKCLIEEVDSDGDGKISFDEFKSVMVKLLES